MYSYCDEKLHFDAADISLDMSSLLGFYHPGHGVLYIKLCFPVF